MLKANLIAHSPKFKTSNMIEKILIDIVENYKPSNLVSNQTIVQ